MSDRLITEIWWEPSQGFDVRAQTVLSDATKVRLDPEDHKLKLKLNSDFRYPTDTDLSVRSRTYEPEAIARILMIQVNAVIPAGTSVGLRLYDGTDERYWDGAAWSGAGAGNWNTETEVNANVSSFDVETSRKFGIVLNLRTTDDRFTPVVESVFVLWESETSIDWAEDLLLNSLTGMFQDELTIPVDYALPPLPADSNSVDLDDYRNDGDLEFRAVEAVYDITTDPGKRSNLLSAYDSATNVVTLSAVVPAGRKLFLRIRTAVNVAYDTSRDYITQAKLPEVVLRDANTVSSSPYPSRAAQGIVRKDTGAAVEIPAPQRMTYEIEMELRTSRTVEQMRLHQSVLKLLTVGPSTEAGPFLRSRATDRRYRLFLTDELRSVEAKDDAGDVRIIRGVFRIQDAAFNLRPAIDTFAVQNLNLSFSRIDAAEELKAQGQDAPVPSTDPEQIQQVT